MIAMWAAQVPKNLPQSPRLLTRQRCTWKGITLRIICFEFFGQIKVALVRVRGIALGRSFDAHLWAKPSMKCLLRLGTQFSEGELLNLARVIVVINGWNRFNFGF